MGYTYRSIGEIDNRTGYVVCFLDNRNSRSHLDEGILKTELSLAVKSKSPVMHCRKN